eukprot:g53428.t1
MAFIAKALFDYEAVESTELSIVKGDRIIVQEQNESGWCLGQKEGTELSGWLPTDYVEKIEDYNMDDEQVEVFEDGEMLGAVQVPAELPTPAAPAPAEKAKPEVIDMPLPPAVPEPVIDTPQPAKPKPQAQAAAPAAAAPAAAAGPTLPTYQPTYRPTPQAVAAPAAAPAAAAAAPPAAVYNDGKSCDKCHKPVTSAFVVAKERTFHADCFGCKDCNQLLGGKAFIERDSSFFCEACYYKNFNPKCGRCGEIIKGQYISALGKSWHPDHFVCTDCGKPFEGNQFHKHDNQPFCEEHFNAKFAENCDKCGKRIDGQVFEALDKKYHLECFVCSEGDHQIGEGVNFHVHEGRVFCPQHFEELFLQRCGECNQIIKGQYVKVLEKHFHPQCWKCSNCGIVISSENCGQANGKFYCRNCVASVGVAPTKTSVPELPASTLAMNNTAPAPAPAPAPAAESKVAAPAPAAPAPAVSTAAPGQVFYSYDVLKADPKKLPPGVDKHKRENYLDDATFNSMFSMDRAAFEKLPDWKKKRLKQKVGLW